MILASSEPGTLGTLGTDFDPFFSQQLLTRANTEKRVPSIPSVPHPVASLLDECRQLGVELWAEDDRLKWRAPSGTMDDQLKSQLREHKTEIIQALVVSRVSRDIPGGPVNPLEARDHPDPPDSGYLEAVSFWPESYQRRWRAVAGEHEARGMTRPQAEWAAFLIAVDAINQVEAKGEMIAFRCPPNPDPRASAHGEGLGS